jgi:hypothetical protein
VGKYIASLTLEIQLIYRILPEYQIHASWYCWHIWVDLLLLIGHQFVCQVMATPRLFASSMSLLCVAGSRMVYEGVQRPGVGLN